MSRIQSLVSRPKRTLAALATVLIAVGITTASGANFTAQSANAANTFAAGTMTIGNSNSSGSTSILTASNMRPADPATVGTVDITNTGSLSGAFTLSKGTLSDTDGVNPISAKLDAVIIDCGAWTVTPPTCASGTNIYTGTLAAMSTNYALGTFGAGIKHRYQFSVSLNGSAGNVYQGGGSTVQFLWNAS
jgi:hypothetical protein